MTNRPVPTLHAALGELDRASNAAIGSLERRGLGEPALALRVAVDDVRRAMAATLPAQAAAARAADLLADDLREATGEHPVTRSCEWVDNVRLFLEQLAAGRLATTSISPLTKALDELESSILDGKNALRELADSYLGHKPAVLHLDEQTGRGLLQGADLLGRRFEAVREEIRKYLPGQLAAGRLPGELRPSATTSDKDRIDVMRKVLDTADMVRGLVRCAEFKEQEENGRIWDDECRRALEAARAAGWGKKQIGRLDGVHGIDVKARKDLDELVELADRDMRRYARLRVLGVAPSTALPPASGASILRFQNLDDFIDRDIKAHPHRGEAAVTRRADGAYTAGPPPDGRTVDEHLDELANRRDSGMTDTERGTPYSMAEAERAVRDHAMDGHHRELMLFLIRRVKRLESEPANRLVAALRVDDKQRNHAKMRTDAELIDYCGGNARRWAEAFVETISRMSDREVLCVLDEGYMVGWFANAIEASKPASTAELIVDIAGLSPGDTIQINGALLKFVRKPLVGSAAEVVYEAPRNLPPAPAPIPESFAETKMDRALRIGAAERTLGEGFIALRLEVDSGIVDELQRRAHAVADAYKRWAICPSGELVRLRFFHENVTARIKALAADHYLYPNNDSVIRAICRDVLAHGGQALMRDDADRRNDR